MNAKKLWGKYFCSVASISLQSDKVYRNIYISIDDEDLENPQRRQLFVKVPRYWPKKIYPCQQYTLHEVPFVSVPPFIGGIIDKMLWQLCAIVTQVDII